ncbi:(2Fe-2S)-binding protein [Methylobacillus glycogenes]|uniref:(2Fe-2S)-binding protein n=1 Tax=Methylobacillus glycogenes TaxID=406 RepID=UPI00046F0053|nr:(2Fe-2S)-binding protein [Methylobacillus glycogenes]MBL8506670.1 (2Fe-2S)-binding protein [Methylobacillus glycogenes]
MYVCVCRAVTDRQILQAARAGAKNLKDLRRELGVAAECGQCASCARQCLREAHAEPNANGLMPISFA